MATRRINRGRARKEELRQQAAERAEQRSQITDQQQLDSLDHRGYVAAKERARLKKRIAKAKEKK